MLYAEIIFVNNEPITEEFEKPYNAQEIGMEGIIETFRDVLPLPGSFAGVNVAPDGKVILVKDDITEHFLDKYIRVKELMENMTLDGFCEGMADGIEALINKKFDIYVVNNYYPGECCECAQTLDEFLKYVYGRMKSENKESYTLYIAGRMSFSW